MKFLQDNAAKSVREIRGPEAYTGRVIAIDASMCLYQFLIMIREGNSGAYSNLTNEAGQVTSHIVGFLSRTIRLMEAGIKPVYVFDGKPPELKLGELQARRERREEAEKRLQEAREAGDDEEVLRNTKMTTKVTKEQNEQTKRLLRLMGVPVVEAPSEAEATCAALCRAGKVHAAATEDADCLTFGTRLLVRNLLAAEAQKKQIYEINLAVALEQLNISMEQFIDFCILCGCDYCDSIKGVGPSSAIKLVVQHGSLENIVAAMEPGKIPDNEFLPRCQVAREFFRECEACDAEALDFEWNEPDLEGLKKFLIEENTFSEERTVRFFERLRNAKQKTKQQPLNRYFFASAPVVREEDKFDPLKKKSSSSAASKAKAKAKAKATSSSSTPTPKEASAADQAADATQREAAPEQVQAATKAGPKAKSTAKSKPAAKPKAKGKAKS
eukprot:CAMPEP_0178403806 /NCGR_PEP_ID=MMETSP0689_2-20121128/17559_1 /TAXON_ID=160604 /ORGANISM="Amphidinium massartii, Strain CS-259" /LENGTH=441 /DNA_ID=CAMNT_0020024773 /DNA_START=1 /DNA_END=1322 /DNA_ORIENTATION=+